MQKKHLLGIGAIGFALIVLLSGLLLAAPRNAHAAGNTYYVAPSGNDANAGTLAAPFQTIQHAANVAQAGDTVLIRKGIYSETVIPKNSGTDGAPITFAPYNNESVTIDGADVVSGPWSAVAGSDHVYTTPLTSSFHSVINQAEQVFVDGKMMIYARWPNTSLDISRPTFSNFESVVSDDGKAPLRTITVTDSHLTQPDGFWNGATIWFQNSLAYQSITGSVTAYTKGQLTFTYNYNNVDTAPVVAGGKYALFGIPAALDAPAEWFHDLQAGTLSLRTPLSDSPANHHIEIKRRDYAFDLDSKSFITIQGLKLFACTITTDDQAGDGKGQFRPSNTVAPANHIVIDGIHAQYLSHFTDQSAWVYGQWENSTGIVLSGTDSVLQNSILEYSAGNGATVLGQRQKVLNNIIHDVDYSATEGAAIGTGMIGITAQDFEIANNTAYTSGKNLLLIRDLQNSDANHPVTRIHHNDFSNCCLQTTDTGVIYTYTLPPDLNAQGVRIDHNLIHDSYEPLSGIGIYIDGDSNHWNIDHNVIWDVQTGIVVGRSYNQIYNNTIQAELNSLSYNTFDPNGPVARNNILGGHVYVDGATVVSDNLPMSIDPQFVDPSASNFSLRGNSPARNTGVVLPPYTDGYKESAPDKGAYEYDPTHPNVPNWTAGSSLPLPTSAAPSHLQGIAAQGHNDLFWQEDASSNQPVVVERLNGVYDWQVVAILPPHTEAFSDPSLTGGVYRVRLADSPYSPLLKLGGRSALGRMVAATYDSFGGGDKQLIVFGPIGGYDHGNWLKYNQMDFPAGLTTFTANIMSWHNCNGNCHIELWQDALPTYAGGPGGGFEIADLPINYTVPDFSAYIDNTVAVNPGYLTGVHDLYLLAAPVDSGKGDIGVLDHFEFNLSPFTVSAPTSLTATAGDAGHIALAWTNTSTNADLLQIERSSDDLTFEQIATVSPSTSSYTDSGLAPNTNYYYRVRAYHDQIDSDYSNVTNAVTTATTGTPATPINVIARVTAAHELTVYWQNNTVFPVDHFQIQRSTDQSFQQDVQTFSVAGNKGQFIDHELAADTTYYYRVEAVSSKNGSSAYSATASQHTATDTPAAPTNLVANALSSQQVVLQWHNNALNEREFQVERSQDNGQSWQRIASFGEDATQYIDSGLTPNTGYLYRVRTVNHSGASPYSNVVQITTLATKPGTNTTIDGASYDDAAFTYGQPSISRSGTDATNIGQNNWLLYRDVDFGKTSPTSFLANLATTDAGRHLEIHLDDRLGPVIADLTVTSTGSLTSYQPETVSLLSSVTGIHDIYIVATNPGTLNLASFSFNTSTSA